MFMPPKEGRKEVSNRPGTPLVSFTLRATPCNVQIVRQKGTETRRGKGGAEYATRGWYARSKNVRHFSTIERARNVSAVLCASISRMPRCGHVDTRAKRLAESSREDLIARARARASPFRVSPVQAAGTEPEARARKILPIFPFSVPCAEHARPLPA